MIEWNCRKYYSTKKLLISRTIPYFNNQQHQISVHYMNILQLVIDEDIRRKVYMSVNNIAIYNKQEALTE